MASGRGLLLASYLLVYLANDLNRTEQAESAFYTKKAVQSLEKSTLSTVRDYAFWGDAYKHLHTQVDADWAYVRQNVGPTLYADFGFQGLFVVNDADRTVYAVIKGELKPVDASQWLKQSMGAILEKARAGQNRRRRRQPSSILTACRRWSPLQRLRRAQTRPFHGMTERRRC